LHRMSVSGFGAMSGGPIGGRNQEGKEYTVECRWSPSRIKNDVMKTHTLMSRFKRLRITCDDFRPMVETAHENCILYLDPPYYEKGKQLYKYNMSPEDHEDLAARLESCPAQWVLSYDDHPVIRRLYSWASFHEIEVTYSNAVCKTVDRPKNKEVVIVPNK
jgi:DNA adenine methylase